MKKQFPGYYKLTEDEQTYLWENCAFVLDANALLNLFRYPKESRDAMLEILESIKERIWIPHQVALEYHVNLETVLYEQKDQYEKLEKECVSELQKLISKLKNLKHSNINTNIMVESLEQSSDLIKKELSTQREEQPDLLTIKDKINDLIGDNIGPEFTQDELNEIFSEGNERYENNVPPGYADSKKNKLYFHKGLQYQAAYGDLIFWKQILNYATNQDVKSIVLISDDRKEDWILVVNGEKKGIHPYLINEFNNVSGGKLFNSYNSVQFIGQAEKFLGFKSSATVSEIIKEIETVYRKEDLNKQMNTLLLNEALNRNKKQDRLLEIIEGRAKRIKSNENQKGQYIFYKLFFDVSDEFIKSEEKEALFPILIRKILKDIFHESEVVDLEYTGEMLMVVFSLPYKLNTLQELKEVKDTISDDLGMYYVEDIINLLKISILA
ncbi:PIN-like domain-containing protein [Paenibacillus hubeiensis]|uniref:PIN-like domain-containing protein n=1 Tax=Paenibacillus hubeiensis TaxID=3077330 RepID=UPI0031BAA185